MLITSLEYRIALENITQAMTQMQPDDRCCVLCGDNDHQAWECRTNVLRAALNEKILKKKVARYESALQRIRDLDYSRAAVNMSAVIAVEIAGKALDDKN